MGLEEAGDVMLVVGSTGFLFSYLQEKWVNICLISVCQNPAIDVDNDKDDDEDTIFTAADSDHAPSVPFLQVFLLFHSVYS